MRILITGGKGQLGRDLVLAFGGEDIYAPDIDELDVTDEDEAPRVISGFRPDAVVHCAALTDTACCERDPLLAQEVNAVGTANVAEACGEAGAALIYISTNEVFDGHCSEPYLESDDPRPINAYGISKLAGEQAALTLVERACVVRTSWLYGAAGNNFPLKVLRAAASGPLRMVTDEVAAPTWTRDLAGAIAALVRAASAPGIYHFANAGRASRYDWAAEVLRLAGRGGGVLTGITSREFHAEFPRAPRKPACSLLANRAGAAAGITLRPWQEALAEFFADCPPDVR